MDLAITRMTRRSLVSAALGASLGCRRQSATRWTAASDGPPSGAGLQVVTVGDRSAADRGGTAVVLLHGWGAPGDDLVPLARALAAPGVQFHLPAGPLPERGGGRAWWHLDAPDRPTYAVDDGSTPQSQLNSATARPHAQLNAARMAVQALLRTIRQRQGPTTLVIAGFSQGGMLALDVALAADPAVDRVAALSGVLMADSVRGLHSASPKPRVLLAHGRADQVVPFRGGELARTLLERHGFPVAWHPFDGGHDIPPEVVAALCSFIAA